MLGAMRFLLRVRVRVAFGIALACAMVAVGPRARAAGRADVDAAETAYADLDYERANKLAADVVARGGLAHAELVRAYRVLARTHAILDHDKEARAAFVWLLTIAPDEKEDAAMPPKVNDRMAEARGALGGYNVKPGIEIAATLRLHEAGTLRVTARDPTHVAKKIVVGWRWGGGAWTTTEIAAGDASVDVAAPPVNATHLDFWAQARDERDDVLFEDGTSALPKTANLPAIETPPPPRRAPKDERQPSIFVSPVFWAIVGGVVLASGAITYAATRPATATSVTLSPTFYCGSLRCN
jgi:hypothetical protein